MQDSLNKAMTLFKMKGIKACLVTESTKGQKTMLVERLFLLIQKLYPDLASKLTGMVLEKDNMKILKMLEDNDDLEKELKAAMDILTKHK